MSMSKKSLTWLSTLLTLLMVASCGKDNTSGTSNRSTSNICQTVNGVYTCSGVNNGGLGNVGNVNNPAVAMIMSRTPCKTSMPQRYAVQAAVPITGLSLNASYVGISLEGDVAVLSSMNGQAVFTAYICGRAGLTQGQGQLVGNPPIAYGPTYQGCLSDEITKATMLLPNQMGGAYTIAFFAPYLIGLCR